MKVYFVYIMSNHYNTVLYTGVTGDLDRRVCEHKNGKGSAFTQKYKCHKLVYFNQTESIDSAIEEEKRIKGGSRKAKEALIESSNPCWLDLSLDWE